MSKPISDIEMLRLALSAIGQGSVTGQILRRKGRAFLFLPEKRQGKLRALALYQPQRRQARAAVMAVRGLCAVGLSRFVLPNREFEDVVADLNPEFLSVIPGTLGVMLGSPEHRVRRAILSYETKGGFEVAKLAVGSEGRKVIEGEVEAIRSMPSETPGVPEIFGIHHGVSSINGQNFSLFRMPYLQGRALVPDEIFMAVELLDCWAAEQPLQRMDEFEEWGVIERTLAEFDSSGKWRERLLEKKLMPVVRHGDFARWNLRKMDDGSLQVLDWEWGTASGLPGMDLVHLVVQDQRLVWCKESKDSLDFCKQFLQKKRCRDYLQKTGWGEDFIDVMMASTAYAFGSGQQENEELFREMIHYL